MKPKMKKKKKIILTVILSLLAFIVLFTVIMLLRVNYLMTPTKGSLIAAYANPKSALLVIDVQNDTLNNPIYKNTAAIMKNINDTISYASQNNMEVIYIKQEYSSNPLDFLLSLGTYQADSEGSQLSSELLSKPEIIFTKNIPDTFSSEQFEKYLINEQIDTLYLVGADASACVYKTATGGVNRGYHVTILKDAVFAGSEDMLNEMIDKYAKIGINVNSTEALFK